MSKQQKAVNTKLSVQVARSALLEGFRTAEGRNPDQNVLALLMAQSALETGNWENIRNNNFGNIKATKGWAGDWTSFPCGEGQTNYPAGDPHCIFRSYESPSAGAADYVRLLTTRPHWHEALLTGDPEAFNRALSLSDPEQGIYPYYTAPPARYLNLLQNRFIKYGGIDPKALGEDLHGGSSEDSPGSQLFGSSVKTPAEYPHGSIALPTLRLGSVGFAVEVVQRILGIEPDGVFGPVTDKTLKEFQTSRSLMPDGVVGLKTWRGLASR